MGYPNTVSRLKDYGWAITNERVTSIYFGPFDSREEAQRFLDDWNAERERYVEAVPMTDAADQALRQARAGEPITKRDNAR